MRGVMCGVVMMWCYLWWCMMGGMVRGQTVVGATLSGVVRDPAGAVVVGARVEVQSVETGRVVVGVSDENGVYRVGPVPPGRYRVVVEAVGFQTVVMEDVELTVGQSGTLNVTLSVGAVTEQVEVRGGGVALVEPTKTEVSEVIEQTRITELPISGRQFIDFALLSPTTSVGKGFSFGATALLAEDVPRLSFGGLFEQHTNLISLDGGDHSVLFNGLQHIGPSQDAVKEFRVLSSTYSVEYGRVMGGIVNIITRSGSNDRRGTVYYYVRNDALDARNILSVPGFDVLRQHQFGASAGGPVVRDRVFYFGNYEGQRRAESPQYTSFILDNLAAINRAKRSLGLSEEDLNKLQTKNYDYVLARADVQLAPTQTLFARYSFADQRNGNFPSVPGGLGAPSTFRQNDVRSQSAMINLTSLIGSGTVNQGFFQFSRKSFTNTPLTFEPNLEVVNIATFGKHISPADFYRENRFQWSDTLSLLWHNHEFKVGVDIGHIRDRLLYSTTMPGFAIFTPESFLGRPPFGRTVPVFFAFAIPRSLLGQPLPRRSVTQLFPDDRFEAAAWTVFHHQTYEVFVQDRWRYRQLTLNYGVRYFLERVPSIFGVQTDKNNVQPRLGISYGFAETKGVVRAGVGVFVAPHFWSRLVGHLTCAGSGPENLALLDPQRAGFFSQTASPCVTVNVVPGPFTSGPALTRFIGGEFPRGPLSINAFGHLVRNFPNPYAEQWSLQIEYEVVKDLSIGIGYLGVHGLKIPNAGIQLNAMPAGTLPNGKTRYQTDPRFGLVQMAFPGTDSVYHGGFFTLNKRLSGGFGLNINYTFSKTLDLPTGYTFRDVFEDPRDIRRDWGLSNQHVGQRFVLTFTGEGPKRWALTRGFKLGVITTLESGRFGTLFTGFDVNGDLEFGTDRVGVVGRNTYRGDSFKQVDLRLTRVMSWRERIRIEPLVEFFNLFNRPNVTQVDTVYGAADFVGPVPRRYKDGVAGALPSFGRPAGTGPARQVQFALRVSF
jgi:hypothetical protein